MGNYQLEIKLLSDLCVSDGGVYNSALDTDICHDELGFPYIPAKRLKGCLRECALELNDWGKDIPIDRLFGREGFMPAAFRLGNAYLEGYQKMQEEILTHRDTLVCHPQNILNHFSYIRTQTAINYNTGIADDASLRTMRVANKDLTFIAEAEVPEEYYHSLDQCCKILKHMGVARTRGLGEVRVTLTESSGKDTVSSNASWEDDADCLIYTVHLEEPLICKSVDGGESRTMDYIEGSKILGLIAQQMKAGGEDITDLMAEGELFCSNAYIEKNGIRMTEVPAVYYEVKNNKKIYINKVYENEETKEKEREKKRQLNPMKHCYTTLDAKGTLIQCGVDIEERYHHRRSSDKSIGRAYDDGSGNSMFYQMSSIMAGQSFQGYILGTRHQIERIYRYLSSASVYYMGYSRSSEYGKVRLSVKASVRKNKILKECRDFMVKLESPAIVYSSKATYSMDAGDLIDEINKTLGIGHAQVDNYINCTTIGGYNVTWQARKPVIGAFDKGTVLQYHLEEPMDLPSFLLLGERVTEGFGEASITKVELDSENYQGQLFSEEDVKEGETLKIADSELLKGVCDDLFLEFIQMEAVRAAKKMFAKTVKNKEALKPTVANMMLMCKESSSLAKIEEAVQKRFQKKSEKKNSKLEEADKILKDVRNNCETVLSDFCRKYKVEEYNFEKDRYECAYMSDYLIELKYQFRKAESKEKGEKAHE